MTLEQSSHKPVRKEPSQEEIQKAILRNGWREAMDLYALHPESSDEEFPEIPLLPDIRLVFRNLTKKVVTLMDKFSPKKP